MCGRKSWTGVQEIKAGEEKRKRIGSKSYAVRRRVKNGFSWAELASWLDVSKQIHRQIMSIPRLYRVNPEITYCNVDVDVYASEALEPLTKALGKKISLHYVGREKNMHSAHFALSSFAKSQQPDLAIRSLAKLIEALPPKPRRLWDQAKHKAFTVGLQSGIEPHYLEYEISQAATRAVAALGASIIITIYETDKPAPGTVPTRREEVPIASVTLLGLRVLRVLLPPPDNRHRIPCYGYELHAYGETWNHSISARMLNRPFGDAVWNFSSSASHRYWRRPSRCFLGSGLARC